MKKQVKKLSLKRTKSLSGKKEVKLIPLLTMPEKIKAFCKIAYQLYLNSINPDRQDAEVRPLESEPPDQFTNKTA